MQVLELFVDGRPTSLEPEVRLDQGQVLVPVHAFSEVMGAEVKSVGGGEELAICKGDLCVPLGATVITVIVDGAMYALLSDLAAPLGLSWEVEGEVLRVQGGREEEIGLGIGKEPPGFTLPDLFTGAPVSLHDYRGKKAIFYMWASW